jgi:cell wall-associated NlpC family hydrolase
MHWSAGFIGIPWRERGRCRQGVDCWGLLRLVYSEVLCIELPSYAEGYITIAERAEIAALLAGNAVLPPWGAVPTGAIAPFDVLLFRRAGLESHVSVVVDVGLMLHIVPGTESFIERYDCGRWRPRLIGAFHHQASKQAAR